APESSIALAMGSVSGITAALQVAAQLNHREHCLHKNERLALFPNLVDSVLSPKLNTGRVLE
ncbi:hypothetical protein, partial [Klebsiella aerogenes]|uniref:hypothetical protein n=1 Tax=Klebsiella aerogenes TaxID=548 RepID=UPI0013CFF4EF